MAIGILGCGPGVGVTHLSVALCSFCSSKQKLRTAYLELHSRNEIAQLMPKGHTNPTDSTGRPLFTLQGADYYPCVSGSDIPLLMNRGYNCLILDMGSLAEADLSEFLRCDRKLVLGSLAPWKHRDYQEFFRNTDSLSNNGEGFCYLVQTGILKDIPEFSREHHISMQSVPFIENPFRIKTELFEFLEGLAGA